MPGDIVLGVEGGEKKRMKRKIVGGPRFAWEDKEGNGNGNDDGNGYGDRGWMAQAPIALSDIIDEQDKINSMEEEVVIDLVLDGIEGCGSAEPVVKKQSG